MKPWHRSRRASSRGLIEQISGSLELQAEYEKAKEAQERATENATFNFTKRRGIAGEIKQYKEQKSEADRFEALVQERDELIRERAMTKLYHIDMGIEDNTRAIVTKNKELAGLRQEQKAQDKAVEEARAEQAKARTAVMQKEKNIKKAEKTLENKKPELVATEAQITHSTRKLNNAAKSKDELVKTETQLQTKVTALQQELVAVENAARKAQG